MVRETRMAEVAFDTIAEVRRLKDVGFAQDQAEAITRSIHAGVTGGVATKADLERLGGEFRTVEAGLRTDMERLGGEVRAVEAGLRADMERLGGEFRTEIANVRTEIAGIRYDLRWIKLIGGAVLAAVVLPWLAEVAAPMFGN